MKTAEWKHVKSEVIKAIYWEETDDIVFKDADAGYPVGILYVCFQTGVVHRYRQVSKSDYQALLEAGSVGAAFHILVKPSRNGERMGKVKI